MLGFLPNTYCKPGNYKYWLSAPAESGEPGYFNSALSTERAGATANAQLTIFLRLLLVKRGKESPAPVDGDHKTFRHRNWDAGEFERYQQEVKRLSEQFWDATGFCIKPPLEYRGLDWPHSNPSLHLNVDCHFQIVWANGPSDAHAIIDCYRLDADSNPGFRTYSPGDRGCWTNFDIIDPTCQGPGCGPKVVKKLTGWIDGIIPIYEEIPAKPQITVLHEVGHLLGLPHVGQFRKSAMCVAAMTLLSTAGKGKGSNDLSCYKGEDDTDRLNIMGEGMNLPFWNGMCWYLRLAQHTGTTLQGWGITKNGAPPLRLQQTASQSSSVPVLTAP